MQPILPAYDDPLFSVILIISLGFIIALATYTWGLYTHQKEEKQLLKFLDQFESVESILETKEMLFEPQMIKPLILLAKAFENSGEYHKSISIYLYLIKNISQEYSKTELLEYLGNTYLHAGFLERAKSIYLDILRKKPRNTAVLYALSVVYEMMHDYPKAKEVIEPLTLLGEEVLTLQSFLDLSEIINDTQHSIEDKITALKAILKTTPELYREVIKALFALDSQEAWREIHPKNIENIIDILWCLPNSQLDLDIISQHQVLHTLYYAKGYLPPSTPWDESGIFAIDMLAIARDNGYKQSDLYFSYLCSHCKQSFPVSFKRCPKCMAIHSVKVENNIGKKSPKTDYSLL